MQALKESGEHIAKVLKAMGDAETRGQLDSADRMFVEAQLAIATALQAVALALLAQEKPNG